MISFGFKRLVSLFTFFALVASQCFLPASVAASESMVLEEIVVTAYGDDGYYGLHWDTNDRMAPFDAATPARISPSATTMNG